MLRQIVKALPGSHQTQRHADIYMASPFLSIIRPPLVTPLVMQSVTRIEKAKWPRSADPVYQSLSFNWHCGGFTILAAPAEITICLPPFASRGPPHPILAMLDY